MVIVILPEIGISYYWLLRELGNWQGLLVDQWQVQIH